MYFESLLQENKQTFIDQTINALGDYGQIQKVTFKKIETVLKKLKIIKAAGLRLLILIKFIKHNTKQTPKILWNIYNAYLNSRSKVPYK